MNFHFSTSSFVQSNQPSSILHVCVSLEYMNQEASRIEHDYQGKPRPRSAKPSLTGFLALIGRLLFYRPVWTKENRQHHNLRFVYVNFSAWHFAGSDMLWAGIALRLFQAMQLNFGKLQLILYRVAQYNEEEEIKKKVCELYYFIYTESFYSHSKTVPYF